FLFFEIRNVQTNFFIFPNFFVEKIHIMKDSISVIKILISSTGEFNKYRRCCVKSRIVDVVYSCSGVVSSGGSGNHAPQYAHQFGRHNFAKGCHGFGDSRSVGQSA
ncbi:MAG TPA: hypothetical protein VGM58_06085, partial [Verrucomicrobiae bacterium]